MEMADNRTERYWSLPGIKLHGYEIGTGFPLIMLHGITSNGRGWDPVADRLSHRFRGIELDQRGHGKSGKPKGDCYGRDDFAGDVAGVIELLDAGPAIVAGHSLGARNALALGAARPELVSAVIAIEFTPFIEVATLDSMDARVKGGDREFSSLEEIRSYLSKRYPLMPPDAIERRTRFGYREVDNGGYRPQADGAAMAATSMRLREDIETALIEISVPTLLIRGALSKFVSAAAFGRACALRPDLPSITVAHADHYVPEVRPTEIARLIIEFAAENHLT